MWLLDVNLPNGLIEVLSHKGIKAESTVSRGWRHLGNGALCAEAQNAGFRTILTRDRLFGESAARALKKFPELSVVIVFLPQAKQEAYLAEFKARWNLDPIKPLSGAILEWP